MKHNLTLSVLAAAVIAATPALAQTTSSATSGTNAASSKSGTMGANTGRTTGTNGATSTTSSTTSTLPPCSSLNHPQAGKLAGKDTGQAKEHSASPVHQDCIEDATGLPASSNSTTSGTSGSTSTS